MVEKIARVMAKAEEKDKWCFGKYMEFKRAFEMAADNGAVNFDFGIYRVRI